MRHFHIAACAGLAMALGLGAASAQSMIRSVGSESGRGSIDTFTCEDCPASEEAELKATYDSFPDGMMMETRVIDGKRKVVRTDNMLGGSPVMTVTSAELVYGSRDAQIAEPGIAPVHATGRTPNAPAGIDSTMTTSSLAEADRGGIGDFELRLN